MFKELTIKPDNPKNSSLSELDFKIKEGINDGYQYIFCAIDMDNKVGNELQRYLRLKNKYKYPIDKPKKGINCTVRFFETHRCTELIFLYYFKYTSRFFQSQNELIKDLNDNCEYIKKEDFFLKTHGLHSYFIKNGGSFEAAIKNSEKSMTEKDVQQRDYTYSEFGRMIKEIEKLKKMS